MQFIRYANVSRGGRLVGLLVNYSMSGTTPQWLWAVQWPYVVNMYQGLVWGFQCCALLSISKIMRLVWLSVWCTRTRQTKISESACPNFYKFRRNLSRVHGNFEAQNKVLEPSIIIINYFIFNYCLLQLIVKSWYYTRISNKDLTGECDKKNMWN
jgi:hypothetical protein